jgi:hypothetical protein
MFNSFGNLAVDPEAALLFIDFGTGNTLHLSGTASVEWQQSGSPGDDDGTGRRACLNLERLVAGHSLPAHEIARVLPGQSKSRQLEAEVPCAYGTR